jgi:hypothetical protein
LLVYELKCVDFYLFTNLINRLEFSSVSFFETLVSKCPLNLMLHHEVVGEM